MDDGLVRQYVRPSEIRLRTARHPDDLDAIKSKLPTAEDYHTLLTGPVKVLKPDRKPLCVYCPGALLDVLDWWQSEAYEVLHSLRNERTDNRGDASGTARIVRGDQKRTRSSLVASALLGSVDPGGIYPFCRLTSWTGQHLDQFEKLFPLLQEIDRYMRGGVPERWRAQRDAIAQVEPEWRIPGTVFTTVTVNNNYSTGCHTDRGDLAAGFSTLAVLRKGDYLGGEIVFPKWGVAVDMRHGDLLLLDAHELHGNTILRWPDGTPAERDRLPDGTFERISLVAYMREKLTECGTEQAEHAKALASAERRSGVATDPV